VVHTGVGEDYGGGPNTIWSHRFSLSNAGLAPVTNGAVVIDDYIIEPEVQPKGFPALGNDLIGMGVFCHEYGHALGLPDLYDTTYVSRGVGAWSVMSYGSHNGLVRDGDCPAHFDAWCKAKLGWITPVDYTLNYQNVPFPSAASTPFAAKLWKDGQATRQYFLVENRYTNGYDAALPGHGLLIWHVDETKGVNNDNTDNTQTWYPISPGGAPSHTNSGNFRVALMQADNLWQLGITNKNTNLLAQFRQNTGDPGDPFPGSANNRLFGPGTAPNSYAYNVGATPGYNSFVTVSNISDAGPVMTADLYTRSPNSGPLVDWVNIAGVVPPFSGAQFSVLDEQHPVVIRAFPGLSGVALSQVQLYLTRASDGRWWNFSSQQWETNSTSSNYDVTSAQQNGLTLAFMTGLPSGTNLVNGSHTFIVRVVNGAGIPTEIQMAMTAAHVPEVRLSLADNSVVNTLRNPLTAVATENSGLGIQRIEIALYWDGAGMEGSPPARWYWNGIVWSTTPFWMGADFPAHPPQATEDYTIGPDARDLLTEKLYTIAARAVDGFGDVATNTIAVFYDPGSPATIYWRYPVGGNWFDAANWTPQRVPAPTDHVVVNAPGDYTVTITGDAGIASLRFGRVVGLDRQHLAIPAGSLSISGSDTNRLYANATLDLGGNLNPGLMHFSSGAVWNWTGGSINGTFRVFPGAAFNLSGSADRMLAGGVLSSAGPGTWSGTGRLLIASGSVFNNSGTLTVLGDAPVFNYTGGTPVFLNTGTIVKTGGTNTVFLPDNGGVAFNNNGIVSVQSGVLALGGGGTGTNGTYSAAAGSRIDWTDGGFSINGNTSFSGGGTNQVRGATLIFGGGTSTLSGGHSFTLASGALAGSSSIAGAGAFNWTGGSISANLSLPVGISLNLSGSADRRLSGMFGSAGTGTWSGTGRLLIASGSVFNNSGTLTVLGDAPVFNYTGGTPVFLNTGTFLKTGGANTVFLPDNGGVAFNNSGTVDLRCGVLTLGGGYTPSPASQLKLAIGGLAAGAQFSQLNLGGTAALAGTLSLTLTNSFMPTNGNSFAVVNYGSLVSQFSARQLPALPFGWVWRLDYGATALTLRIEPGQSLSSPAAVTGGPFGFDVTGLASSNAIVMASTNLVNWIPIVTNTPFNGSFHFTDPQGHQLPYRYYQVLFP
jgi:hypothetical protein